MAVKVTFTNEITLSNALQLGIRVRFEVFQVHMFVRPPRCCYKSHSPNQTLFNCDRSVHYSRCAGQYESSSFYPCQAVNLKYAICGGPHVSFSLMTTTFYLFKRIFSLLSVSIHCEGAVRIMCSLPTPGAPKGDSLLV